MTTRDQLKTYRMVAETPNGTVTVDVVLRGFATGIERVEEDVKAWLDFNIGYGGAWVDKGTDRTTYTVVV